MKIISLRARQILDSRAIPTIEAILETEKGVFCSSVPSGTSTGRGEAFELRDGNSEFLGKGVRQAVQNINQVIQEALLAKEFSSQKEIDEFLIALDGTANKSRLGANAILAVSIAFSRAFARQEHQTLFQFLSQQTSQLTKENEQQQEGLSFGLMPKPCFNILEGGKHAGSDLEVQEFMIVPFGESFEKELQMAAEIYHHLKIILMKHCGSLAMNKGYEAGFAPALKKTEQALDFLMQAIESAGYKEKVKIALDIAANNLVYNGKNKYKINGKLITQDKLLDYYLKLLKKYPILFLEDPFSENNNASWQRLNEQVAGFSPQPFIVADDLTTTNIKRIEMAKEQNLCGGVIVKPNQIGTVWETIQAAMLAKSVGWKIIVSHRSGETNDDFIADLAVGLKADFIKAGAPAGGERVAKYNRLLEIEKEIKN